MDVAAPVVGARPHRGRAMRLVTSLLAGFAMSLVLTAVVSARTQVTEIDFHVFYESAQAWRSGGDLYATSAEFPNLNPPHFVVAFALLTLFPERVAIAIWLALNLGAAAAAAMAIWRELRLPRSFVAVATGLAAAGLSTGLLFGLEEGHPIGLFTLCVTAAWRAHRHGRPVLAGLLIGLLASVKPFFGCLLLVPLVRREWWGVMWAVAVAACAASAGVLFAGVPSFFRWIETGRQVTWFHHPLNASLAGLLSRAGLGWQFWAMIVAVLMAATVIALRRSRSLDASWLSAGLAALLISPLGWAYYLPLLAAPLTAVAMRRPVLVVAGLGFVWPVPFVMVLAPPEGLAAATICSITAWSLLAMWCAAVHPLLIGWRSGGGLTGV
jgi:hypothetical protein